MTDAAADGFSAESGLVHGGTSREPGQPVPPPLAPASIFVSAGQPEPARGYGRDGNPGWEALEGTLGGIERAEAVAFASGQAASMALMLALTEGRDQVVLPADGYYRARTLVRMLRPHDAAPVQVDLRCCGPRPRPTRCYGWRTWTGSPTRRRPPARP